MSGTGKTPGQIACEAYDLDLFHEGGHDPDIWQTRGERERHAWEAAASAAVAAAVDPTAQDYDNAAEILSLRDQLAGVRRELDIARDDFLFERKQVIALRRVVAEMLTCAETGDAALFDDDQVTEWRERSGVEAAPKVATAGTEHVARELLDPGNPDAWQRVADMPAEGA